MELGDAIGLAAALATLPGLLTQRRQDLQALALLANAAFIAYGLTLDLFPVVAAHIVLLPCNLYRLHKLRELAVLRGRRRKPTNVFLRLEGGVSRP